MKKIRFGVFETNSSSTHSICIAKNAELLIPKSIHFSFGEFGWEQDTLDSMHEKASYLYTGLFANDRELDFDEIKEYLEKKGVEVSAEVPIWKEYTYEGNNGGKYVDNGGYVDHSGDMTEFLNAVCEDKERLMRYLFSGLSFIRTGNDNEDSDISINVKYEYDGYYKGN